MSRQIQIRRGTAAQHSSFTGAIGEVTMDTTNNSLRVHDGVTPGGNETMSVNKFYSNITNCITEVRHDIKLELNTNAMVLKSGSKFFVPNGFEADGTTSKFNTITLSNDINGTGGWAGANVPQLLFVIGGTYLNIFPVQYCFSGSVPPTSFFNNKWAIWYDTTNNIIKWTTDAGDTWSANYSLPLAVVIETTNENVINKIEQIFNGFGFIGSTVFALPGVKGMSPNGKNADGTYKNSFWNTNSIVTKTFTDTNISDISFQGSVFNCSTYSLDCNNYLHNSSGIQENSTVIGKIARTNGKIDYFDFYDVFKIADYNDTEYITKQSMPGNKYTNLTLGTSGSAYTAPADGYFVLIKQSGGVNEWANFENEGNGLSLGVYPPSGMNGRLFFPASKGDVIRVNYTLSGATGRFKFIYANGAK